MGHLTDIDLGSFTVKQSMLRSESGDYNAARKLTKYVLGLLTAATVVWGLGWMMGWILGMAWIFSSWRLYYS